jgi:hypothetical protein
MEFMPGSGHGHLLQSHSSQLRICFSNRLFEQQTLEAYVFPRDGRVTFQRFSGMAWRLLQNCDVAGWGTT